MTFLERAMFGLAFYCGKTLVTSGKLPITLNPSVESSKPTYKYIMKMEQNKIERLIHIIFISIVVLTLCCCRTSDRLVIEGAWFIESATLEGENVGYRYFVGNNVGFTSDGICSFPRPYRVNTGFSSWEFTGNGIRIISQTPFFNDIFKIDTLNKHRFVIRNSTKRVLFTRAF